MLINFAGAITNNPEDNKRYKKIITIPESHGHTVIHRGHEKLPATKVLNKSDKEIKEIVDFINSSMRNCDVFITDTTKPNVGVGFEIAEAIALKKPTLVLRHSKAKKSPMANIETHESKYITYREFDDNNLEQIILKFLKEAKGKLNTRFSLTISTELNKYLSWSAEDQRIPKANVVRELLETMESKNKKYKEHLGRILAKK